VYNETLRKEIMHRILSKEVLITVAGVAAAYAVGALVERGLKAL